MRPRPVAGISVSGRLYIIHVVASVTSRSHLLLYGQQAVMTSSIFVHDIQAPAPLEEFFLPLRDEVRCAAGLLREPDLGSRCGRDQPMLSKGAGMHWRQAADPDTSCHA